MNYDDLRNASRFGAVDTAMTELKRVTSLTEAQYDSFMDRAAKKAESLGCTMTDYINEITDFSRAGFGQDGFENVEKMVDTFLENIVHTEVQRWMVMSNGTN